MVLITLLVTFSYLIYHASGNPGSNAVGPRSMQVRDGTPSSTGISGGYYYSWSIDNPDQATYINGEEGQFNITWRSNANFVGGKGWNPGTVNRTLRYTGLYQPSGNSYVSLYGWTRNPLIEYFITETYSSLFPASGARGLGTVDCDGSIYDILVATRYNQPSIDGTQTFQQFWSVRRNKKPVGGVVNGSITAKCHFDAFAKYGARLGSEHNYQIFALEGHYSSCSASFTIS